MSNVKTKRLALILISILLIATTICSCASNESKIVGRWEKIYGSGFEYLEFFSDGTYDSNKVNYSGNYSIDGNRIKLTGILVESKVYTFEIKGDVLNFLYDDGDGIYASYKRAD